MRKNVHAAVAAFTLFALAGCASTGDLVTAPSVDLKNVEATELGFSGQTFLLAFDVRNPNPFPLPVSTVSYGVELDGYRFATGSTAAGFTVPASGQAQFAISVELDLLKTAPPLLYIVKDSRERDVPYELKGEFGLDIPMTGPVHFQNSGAVRLDEISRQAFKRH
ncbi:MAG: LEA type 2 family protein [Woeseiaceae bacterium]|nr:LEA type 2 family protein [Woeseiaceae bacterium]